MANRKTGHWQLTNSDGEVRELTAEDAAKAESFSSLPEAEQTMLPSLRMRGLQKAPRKIPISIRLSPDVAEGLRATGEGIAAARRRSSAILAGDRWKVKRENLKLRSPAG